MARRTIEADENTKSKRATGTRGGSRGARGKQGHGQAAAQALEEGSGRRETVSTTPSNKGLTRTTSRGTRGKASAARRATTKTPRTKTRAKAKGNRQAAR